MSIRLSVCLLTRDEVGNIERVLRSVDGVADEVIVADTGSSDGTVRHARALGATVVPHVWSEDFSAGRNAALAAASGDWVLWLNPDEELTPESGPLIRSLIDRDSSTDAEIFGHRARVRTIARVERLDQFAETLDLRLFRRRHDLRYEGRVHPGFPGSLGESVSRDGQRVSDSEIVILVHAYLSKLSQAKLRWAARLLEKELQDRPGRLHSLIEYGRTLISLDDPKGHEAMSEAAEQLIPALNDLAPPSPDAQKVLEYLLTTSPEHVRGAISAQQAAGLALRWFPKSPPLLWAIAGAAFQRGRFEAAADLLQQLVRMGETGAYDRSQGFDLRIIGPWAWQNLGQCMRALGKIDEARRCFESMRLDPEFLEQAESLLAECTSPVAPTPP